MSNKNNNKQERKPLTDRGVASMKPGDVKSDTAEHTGLRVVCGQTGRKSFFYRYRSPQTQKLTQVTLGHYPEMSLLEARAEHCKLKKIRAGGQCPKLYLSEEKDKKEAELKASLAEGKANSFLVKDVVELYLTEYIETRNVNGKVIPGARVEKGQKEIRRTLVKDVSNVIGDETAVSITKKDVTRLINDIVNRGATTQAGNVLRELNAAYEYAIGVGKLDDDFVNPVEQARKGLVKAHKGKLTASKRTRALSKKELKQFLDWLPVSGFSVAQKNVLFFALMTGTRSGEVCNARWEDIDFENKVWHIPDPKNKIPRNVQLSKQAILMLEYLKKVNALYPFQTAATRSPIKQKSLTETLWALRNPEKVAYNRKFTSEQLPPKFLDDWVPHDLRRTVRTGLASLQCPMEVAETIIGHVKQGVVGIYDQHQYEPQCKEWLQKWCDYMDALVLQTSPTK